MLSTAISAFISVCVSVQDPYWGNSHVVISTAETNRCQRRFLTLPLFQPSEQNIDCCICMARYDFLITFRDLCETVLELQPVNVSRTVITNNSKNKNNGEQHLYSRFRYTWRG